MTEAKSERSVMQEAADESTPAERLRELAKGGAEVARLVAKNPNTPVAVLEKLAGDDYQDVCWTVAGNPNTPAPLRRYLIASEDLADAYTSQAYEIIKMVYAEDDDEDDDGRVGWLRDSNNWSECAIIYLNQKIDNGEAIIIENYDDENFINYIINYYQDI